MKVIIYHRRADVQLEEVTTIEVDMLHLRGIGISGVSFRETSPAIYADEELGRIDQQGESTHLVGKEYAKEYPQPIQLHEDTKLFGIPTTIWPKEKTK